MFLATWRFCDEQRELYELCEQGEQGEQQKCISKCITSDADALAPRQFRGPGQDANRFAAVEFRLPIVNHPDENFKRLSPRSTFMAFPL